MAVLQVDNTKEWEMIADARLSEKDANEKKTMNTHLHVLESYTNLYRIWPEEDLGKSICLLIDNFLDYIVDSQTNHLKLFFDEQWVPKSDIISYGHDIEAAWLVQESRGGVVGVGQAGEAERRVDVAEAGQRRRHEHLDQRLVAGGLEVLDERGDLGVHVLLHRLDHPGVVDLRLEHRSALRLRAAPADEHGPVRKEDGVEVNAGQARRRRLHVRRRRLIKVDGFGVSGGVGHLPGHLLDRHDELHAAREEEERGQQRLNDPQRDVHVGIPSRTGRTSMVPCLVVGCAPATRSASCRSAHSMMS